MLKNVSRIVILTSISLLLFLLIVNRWVSQFSSPEIHSQSQVNSQKMKEKPKSNQKQKDTQKQKHKQIDQYNDKQIQIQEQQSMQSSSIQPHQSVQPTFNLTQCMEILLKYKEQQQNSDQKIQDYDNYVNQLQAAEFNLKYQNNHQKQKVFLEYDELHLKYFQCMLFCPQIASINLTTKVKEKYFQSIQNKVIVCQYARIFNDGAIHAKKRLPPYHKYQQKACTNLQRYERVLSKLKQVGDIGQ